MPISLLVAIVIVFVPVALRVPPMLVLIPPLMAFAPAMFASLTQFAALAICLGAVSPVFLDGPVEFMVGVGHTTLAPIVVLGVKPWNRAEKQCCG